MTDIYIVSYNRERRKSKLRPQGRRRSKVGETNTRSQEMRGKEEKGWNVGLAWGFDKEDKKRTRERNKSQMGGCVTP